MATISRGTKKEKFQFIATHKEQLGVKRLCEHLEVSRSGFYHWLQRGESIRSQSDRHLMTYIQRIFNNNKGIYGSPRIHQALRNEGIFVSRKRVARLMKINGLKGRFARIYRYRTDTFERNYIEDNHRLTLDKPNTINQHWTTDLTYLKLGKKWVYLVVILDLYSRRVVGWSLGHNKTGDLFLRALGFAIRKRKPAQGLLLHSDRGSEFISHMVKAKVEKLGIVRSMSRPYRSIDNAEMESFFQKLKGEYLEGKTFLSFKQLRKNIASYINHFYNKKRLHSQLGYMSPMEFEELTV